MERIGWQFDWATYHAHLNDLSDDTATNLEGDGHKPGFWVPTKNAVRAALGGWKAGEKGRWWRRLTRRWTSSKSACPTRLRRTRYG